MDLGYETILATSGLCCGPVRRFSQRQRSLNRCLAFQPVHILKATGQFSPAAAAFSHVLREVAIGQLEKPLAGMDDQGAFLGHEHQVRQQLFTAPGPLGGYLDDLVALALGQGRQLAEGENQHAPLIGHGSQQIPAAAVHRHEGVRFAFVQRGRGRFERRDLEVGRGTADSIEVTDGLAEGELVVVDGGFALKSEMLSELTVEE